MSVENKQQAEPKEMMQEVDRFVDGLSKAVKTKLRMPTGFSRMCICGMGGSAIAGDIIADAVMTSWNVPVQVIRSTKLPSWADENTLVIASSYSGKTRETLMMYDHAKEKGCTLVVITAGGDLRDKCLLNSDKLIELPGNMQPRSSIGLTIGYLANIIEITGGPKIRSELIRLIPMLRKCRGNIWMRNTDSEAKRIAERMYGTVPAVYAAGPLASVAMRWKTQINENSKMMAFSGTIQEMGHNEITGWSECVQRSKCRPVFLCEEDTTDTMREMVQESVDILTSSGVDPEIIIVEGRTDLERSLKAVMLGDY
ncbi:MAG: SIS domain-containing protein, partial [Methanomassiliicoccaceae archaeon]|nr:SIS domain-containing protein [Methanomassiliicoccaceae archaeon]